MGRLGRVPSFSNLACKNLHQSKLLSVSKISYTLFIRLETKTFLIKKVRSLWGRKILFKKSRNHPRSRWTCKFFLRLFHFQVSLNLTWPYKQIKRISMICLRNDGSIKNVSVGILMLENKFLLPYVSNLHFRFLKHRPHIPVKKMTWSYW